MCVSIPGRIVAVPAAPGGPGMVDVGGAVREVSLALLDTAPDPGEWVLVHSGFALTTMDDAEAREILALLRQPAPADLGGAGRDVS